MATYSTQAKCDPTLSQDFSLVNRMASFGWTEREVKVSTHKGEIAGPFRCFFRESMIGEEVADDVTSSTRSNVVVTSDGDVGSQAQVVTQFAPNTHVKCSQNGFGEQNQHYSTLSEPASIQGKSPLEEGVAKVSYGRAGATFATLPPPTKNGQDDDCDNGVFLVADDAQILAQANGAVSFGSISSIKNMRFEDDSFNVAYDSEFYYIGRQRYILSYQFAFVRPGQISMLTEVILFPCTDSPLRLSQVINYILEEWQIDYTYKTWGYRGYCEGVDYRDTRTWTVPAFGRGGVVRRRTFWNYEQAVSACADSAVKKALESRGKGKAVSDYIEHDDGKTEIVYRDMVNGYPIGYINNYSKANKQAIPVTIICHYGSADLPGYSYAEDFEKDVMIRLSQVQGGLVTLKSFYLHNPMMSAFWRCLPVRISFRDTMCHTVGDSRSLEALGKAIGIPKVDLPGGYSKDDMKSFLMADLGNYCEYASTDSVIALLYASELWGYNKQIPLTITSAAVKAAVPVMKEYYGIDKNDTATFNRIYRGLHKVDKGLVARKDRPGYLDATALEPVSEDARILQDMARLAYKGGYNGSSRIGYYYHHTYDYDLKNAYPTMMAIVMDIDWDNPIAFEGTNQPLTPTILRSPIDPFFAYVTFSFPNDVKYPCIPVSADGCIIYPRTSEGLDGVYASAPELWLALRLGAKVHCKRYVMGNIRLQNGEPSHVLYTVVKQLIEDRSQAKMIFGKNSLMQALIKVAVNGLYGKTAQDVVDKYSWSAHSAEMQNIGMSALTSPYHACMTTAGVRAVLLAAMNEVHDAGFTAYSVTTDGFISDIPEDRMKAFPLYGLARFVHSSRDMLTGDPEMWEKKATNWELLNLTTRGNVAVQEEGVLAHNSYVTGYDKDSRADRDAMLLRSFLRRSALLTQGTRFEKFKYLSARRDRRDFAAYDQIRYIRMDFDFKRCPMRCSFCPVNKDFFLTVQEQEYMGIDESLVTGEIANFDTEPYDTVAEFRRYKAVAKTCPVLATMADWDKYFAKLNQSCCNTCVQIKDLEWARLMSCIRAYRMSVPLSALGDQPVQLPVLDTYTREEKFDWINKHNRSKKEFGLNNWKDCGRQSRLTQILPESEFIDLLNEMIADSAVAQNC